VGVSYEQGTPANGALFAYFLVLSAALWALSNIILFVGLNLGSVELNAFFRSKSGMDMSQIAYLCEDMPPGVAQEATKAGGGQADLIWVSRWGRRGSGSKQRHVPWRGGGRHSGLYRGM
jgi:hypothetical protein